MERAYRKISAEHTAGVTVFPSATDVRAANATSASFSSFESLRRWLKDQKCVRDDKRAIPLFTRGLCEGDRLKANIAGNLLVILDCDDTGVRPDQAHDKLDLLEVDHVIHTTWSHGGSKDLHRYRIFVDYLAEGWGDLRTITTDLFERLGIEPTRESVTGTAFFVPAIATERRGAYGFYSSITDGGSAWTPPAPETDEKLEKATPTTSVAAEEDAVDPDEVRSALAAIPNDQGYAHWIRVGAALHGWGHEAGRDLWDEWSAREPYGGGYDDAEQDAKWRSFNAERAEGVGIATIYYLAREEGWRPEQREERQSAAQDFAEFASERLTLLRGMNRVHAYLALGTGRVVDFSDPAELQFLTIPAFIDLYRQPLVGTRQFGPGGERTAPVGEVWLRHWDHRRTYRRMDFLPPGGSEKLPPATLNLWQGWGTKPSPDSCELQLEHIKEVIADGDEDVYQWLLAWCAHMVQCPWEKPKTAVVLRGEEGVGKGLFAEMLLRIAGRAHGIQITQPKHLTGQFNSHLASKILVFADEVTWGGRVQEEGILKALISEERVMLEPKGLDVISARSFCRVVISSNNDWVVPAGRTARRLLVLDVGNQRRGRTDYFRPLVQEIHGGGPGGLMRYLKGLDLEALPDPRTVIETAALAEQKMESLSGPDGWLVAAANQGTFGDGHWPHPASDGIPVDELFQSYVNHSRMSGAKRNRINQQISTYLRRVFGPRFAYGPRQGTMRTRIFPELPEARRLIEAHLHMRVVWDDAEGGDLPRTLPMGDPTDEAR